MTKKEGTTIWVPKKIRKEIERLKNQDYEPNHNVIMRALKSLDDEEG